jgi:hypothetical protein
VQISSDHVRVVSNVCFLEVWCLVAVRGAWGVRGSGSARAMVRAATPSAGGYAAFGYLGQVLYCERWSRRPSPLSLGRWECERERWAYREEALDLVSSRT